MTYVPRLSPRNTVTRRKNVPRFVGRLHSSTPLPILHSLFQVFFPPLHFHAFNPFTPAFAPSPALAYLPLIHRRATCSPYVVQYLILACPRRNPQQLAEHGEPRLFVRRLDQPRSKRGNSHRGGGNFHVDTRSSSAALPLVFMVSDRFPCSCSFL
jgi:hypothetical protein